MHIEEFELEKFIHWSWSLPIYIIAKRWWNARNHGRKWESIDEQTTEIKPASPTFNLIPQFKKLDIWRYQRMKLLQFGHQHYSYG